MGGMKYQPFICDLGYHEGKPPLVRRPTDCPNEDTHEPEPEEYGAWHEWAKAKGQTHVQVRCSECRLFAIWRPKRGAGITA